MELIGIKNFSVLFFAPGVVRGARFERAEQTGMSELDFYKELYEIGITGLAEDILEKYMDEKDIEYMKVFCIRNGLI